MLSPVSCTFSADNSTDSKHSCFADSAYGSSPAMKWDVLDDLPEPVFDQDWRFQITLQDVGPATHMFKSHLFHSPIPSALPPWHIYHQEESLLFQETFQNITELEDIGMELEAQEEEEEVESDITLSPTLSFGDADEPTAVSHSGSKISRTKQAIKQPHHKGPKRRDNGGRCFPCDMCSSTFSRNHDLKR